MSSARYGRAFNGSKPASLLTLLPVDPRPVDLDDLLINAVAVSILFDGGSTCLIRSIVIDDQESPWRQVRIEIGEAVHGGLIEVTIETHNGPAPRRELWQGIAEHSRDEFDAVIQQVESCKVGLHLVNAHSKLTIEMEGQAFIVRIDFWTGWGDAIEGIRQHHLAALRSVGRQHGSHEHRGTPSPDARLDQVARHAKAQRLLDAEFEVVQALTAKHRQKVARVRL